MSFFLRVKFFYTSEHKFSNSARKRRASLPVCTVRTCVPEKCKGKKLNKQINER